MSEELFFLVMEFKFLSIIIKINFYIFQIIHFLGPDRGNFEMCIILLSHKRFQKSRVCKFSWNVFFLVSTNIIFFPNFGFSTVFMTTTDNSLVFFLKKG